MGAPMGPPLEPMHPREVLVRAALGLADADGEDPVEYRRAVDRLRKAAVNYVRRTGGRLERDHARADSGQRGQEGTSEQGEGGGAS